MAKTQREKITKQALDILEISQNGVRYSDLFRQVAEKLPEVPHNSIHGTIWDLDKKISQIVKPERGLFILRKYISAADSLGKERFGKLITIIDKTIPPSEESFYKSFANYLVQDLGECTKAISLGGNKFGDKWGTPDVLGVYRFSETESVRPPIEIISAEIKTDTAQLITAFGQACAYKVFSHKVYLVVPKDAEKDISRIDSLCSRFGIGLILFNRLNVENPGFEIRTRASKSEPDYFYVNEYLLKLGDLKRSLF